MSIPFPYPGPIPPEINPPIEPGYYQPSRFVISGISLGANTTITTSVPHNYVVGQLVRLLIPEVYGSYQISGQQGYVISIPNPNQVVVNINSLNSNAFISVPAYSINSPQIMAIGEINTGAINSNGLQNQTTYIPGSFINISPQ